MDEKSQRHTTFRLYYVQFAKRLRGDATEWVMDNILLGAFMLVVPPLAVYLRHPDAKLDWATIRIALWLYLAVFVVYMIVHCLRTAWLLDDDKIGQIETATALSKQSASERDAIKRQIYDGRPRLSLEAMACRGDEWKKASFIFFIQNIGQRAAREIRFDTVKSPSGAWALRLDTVGTLIANQRPPLWFDVLCQDREMSRGNAAHWLRVFFEESKGFAVGKFTYTITARFYDANDSECTEQWTLECTMPKMELKITPVVMPPL
ncbi:MAG: hypothetical protein WCA76_08085 [Candidatus Sulfotelmatobacter sp.]|jgi:hypothetical protein